MAKYDVKFSCGHVDEVQLFGKNSERERKIKYFEEYGTCSECYKKEKEERIKRENEQAKKETETIKLPELTGTEKQITWAITLRLTWLKEAKEELEALKDFLNRHGENSTPERVEKAERILKYLNKSIQELLMKETTASFWINNRHSSGRSFVKTTMREWFEKEKEKEEEQC